MSVTYGIMLAVAVLSLIGYCIIVRKKEKWLLLLYVAGCIVELGYLLLSLSQTLEFAYAATKITYLGHILMLMCMFLLIVKLCGFRYKKALPIAFAAVAALMFAMVLTIGHLDWFYVSAEWDYADGAAKLIEKDYGFLHDVYLVYVLSCFVGMIAAILHSARLKKVASLKYAGMLLAVVLGNITMWLVEKSVSWNFEFLSVSYLMSEMVLFFVYWMMQDHVHISDVSPSPIVVVDAMNGGEKLQAVLEHLPEHTMLTAKEKEVLATVLEGKSRKEIAAELHISENTVKTHLTHLYEKLNVSGREELLALAYKQ